MTDGSGEGAGVAQAGTNADAHMGPEAGKDRQARQAIADPARLAAVRATGLLDTDAEAVFDRLTRLAVRLVGVPAAFISLVDEHRDFYKSACGFGEPLAAAREITGPTFCHYAIQSATPLVIPDTAADPRYRDVPTVRSLGVAAYVGVPLMVHGQAVGSFCVIDTHPRAWTPDELEILTELAAAAEREVELRVALRAAEATNQQLQDQAAELEAQSEELQMAATQLEEQTESADALRQVAEQARERMVGVLEAMSDAYFALDADFRISAVNAAMERNVGLSRGALLGRSMWEALPGTVGNVFERSYRATATDRVAAHFTHDYSDGRLELVSEVDVYPAEGGGIAVFWRDVTARLQADAQLRTREAELRTFADALPTLAWSARADGWVEWYNARWYAYTGTTPADMEGWGWRSVHDPEVLPAVLEQWARAIATGEPFEMTLPIRGTDGRFRPFLTRGAPVRGPDGTVQRWIGMNTDVEAEHAARRLAEEANLAKSTFLATMSHELRTPLNAISGYLELLLMEIRGPLTDAQRADLERMQRSQRHLTGLINDVLHFAKLDVGHIEFSITPVDVGDVLHHVEELVTPQCAAKQIRCTLEIPSPPPSAAADRERLAQILLNMLSNAVKYTDAGGRIQAVCEEGEQEVRIVVTDSGRGIPSDQLERIFEPFVQVGRRLNSSVGDEGVGLGLAISRSLAEGMNGTLTVESQMGEGSSFTLRLPRATPRPA